MGLIRYRLTVADDSVLEMFERFEVADEQVHSFHRQDSHDRLRKRWDNAPHHPDVQTHPHHVHDGSEDSILAHQSVTAEEVLMYVTQALANQ